MSENRLPAEVETGESHYPEWRGLLLAELALARVPELLVHKEPPHATPGFRYDFLVATPDGFCFFVEVEAFSSTELRLKEVESSDELRWKIDAPSIRLAKRSRSPVVLFLFDADTDHGRYLRLDTLPTSAAKARNTVKLPATNTINPTNLRRLVSDLRDKIAS